MKVSYLVRKGLTKKMLIGLTSQIRAYFFNRITAAYLNLLNEMGCLMKDVTVLD